MSRRLQQLVDVPLAVASDGVLLVGVAWCTDAKTVEAALAAALASGRPIFIGVAVDALQGRLLRDLGDVVADSIGRFAVEIFRLGPEGRRARNTPPPTLEEVPKAAPIHASSAARRRSRSRRP